jgi:diaminohydroxyphosphoribosylaminopyrimidine deaminase/5-amino-6-(5-phosphoribosylamino)uracil reductase
MVGAVLVHDGRIIGEGWHKEYGGPHAEVNCFASVAEEDKHLILQSTMYVSLEPCAHYGKTPPCANRLVQEQVKEVIICNTDPNDKVDGKGINILKQAGIAVTTGILEAEGRWVNRRFFSIQERKRPYVILKWAQSADGYIAPVDRTRYQLSSRHSQQLVHKWRTEEDAIMVGYTTALNDNPQLTARLWEGKNPLRIVLDKNLQLPDTHKLFDAGAETWVLNNSKSGRANNVEYVQLDFNENIIPQLLYKLYAAGKQSLIVEGGAKLLESFISAGLWDEARVFATEAILSSGIHAPILQDGVHAEQTLIGSDMLHLYINKNSPYPFMPGYEL